MDAPDRQLLADYAAPGVFTTLDGEAADFADAAPDEVAGVVALVQGLVIHEGLTQLYGAATPPERAGEKQLHSAAAMLRRAKQLDPRHLGAPRAPEHRVIGVCRHFATLFVAIMRRKCVPARARCGFATYFAAGKHLDHWVGEYWDADAGRWVLVDAQVDEAQRRHFNLGIDTLDVPREAFLVGGDAWSACQDGADPMSFGVAGTSMWGLVEVYGDLFQDLAALQKIELLPWGWYGLAKDEAGMTEIGLIDRLASISSRADSSALSQLRGLLAADPRLRVPPEEVAAAATADAAATAGLAR